MPDSPVSKTPRRYTQLSLLATSVVATVALVIACTDGNAKAKPNFVTKEAPRAGVLAKIAGQEITEEELIGDEKMELFELKKREYDFRMDRLNKLIVDRMVGAEAEKAKMPVAEFIDKKVVGGPIKVSEKDFNKFVEERKFPKDQINDDIRGRINGFLTQQVRQDKIDAYVAKLTRGNPVEVYFTKPKMNVAVEVGTGAVWGKDSAPVTIIEFSDFQCPYCSQGADRLADIKKKYGEKKVRIAFRHFPLPMHKDAPAASEASMCVHEQNKDKFWKFHDVAFKNQQALDPASLEKYAKDVGVDVKKFKECFDAKKYAQHVQDDLKYGEKIGVRSTPTFIINGQLVAGALPMDQFSEIIDEELAAKK